MSKIGRFYQGSLKTEGVKNAQVCIIACFNENCDLVIYDIKRRAGTELSNLLKTISKVTDYAQEHKAKVIIECKKIPACYLRKIGFETINGCTFFNI